MNNNGIIVSFLWKFAERIGNQLMTFVVQIVLARLLAPSDFGTLAIILVFVNLAAVVVQSGLNTALIQAREVDDQDYSTVFWMSIVVALLLQGVIVLAAPSIGEFYGTNELIAPLRAMSFMLPLSALSAVQVASLTRQLKFKKLFVVNTGAVLFSGACGIAGAAMGLGLWALVVQQLVAATTNTVLLFSMTRWHPRFVFSVSRAATLFGFGWKLLVSGLLSTGYQSVSDLIIGKMFSVKELGLVSQGGKIPAALGTALEGSIQPVMLVAISRLQTNLSAVRGATRRALKTSTFLIFPSMACLALVAYPLVGLVLGEKWLGAVPFLQMYCVVYALMPIHSANLQAINGIGRSDLFLILEIIKRVTGLGILLMTAFVTHNVYAIVAGYMASSFIASFINAWPNRHLLGYSYMDQIRDVAPSLILTFVSLVVTYPLLLLPVPGYVTVLLCACVMAICYLTLATLTKVEALTYVRDTLRSLISDRKGQLDDGQ